MVHPLFKPYGTHTLLPYQDPWICEICNRAVASLTLGKSDTLFDFGAGAQHMFFLTGGTLLYKRPNGLEAPGIKSFVNIRQGDWCAEAVLWVPWVHCGTAVAVIPSQIVSL